MSDYQWTEADVADAKRRAAIKHLEAQELRRTAGRIEEEFWEKKLVSRFPELEHRTHEVYCAVVSFSDGDQECLCRGPISSGWRVGEIEMLVWHKGSKGKFHKTAVRYDCCQIVPFLKQVSRLSSSEAAA